MAEQCFENTPLEDILLCPNVETQAGLVPETYFLPHPFIQTMEVPVLDADSDYKKMGTISEDIVPIAGQGFVKMSLMIDMNSVTSNLVGNRGNKKDQTTLNIFIPGTRAEVLGFKRLYKNVPGVFVVKDQNGRTFVVGTKDAPAYIDNLEFTTGAGPEDDNGGTGTIIANTNLFEYTGDIVLKTEDPEPPVGG